MGVHFWRRMGYVHLAGMGPILGAQVHRAGNVPIVRSVDIGVICECVVDVFTYPLVVYFVTVLLSYKIDCVESAPTL